MRLPWDRQYLKISFHVIVTLLIIFGIGVVIQNIIPITVSIGLVISKLVSIISPLIIGIAIAYLLDPLVDIYQNRVVETLHEKFKERARSSRRTRSTRSRAISSLLAYLTVILVFVLIGILFSTSIGNHRGFKNMDNLVTSINAYTESFNNMIQNIQDKLDDMGFLQESENAIEELTGQLGSYVQNITSKVVDAIAKAGNQVINFTMAVVIAFYLLKDKVAILKLIDRLSKILIPDRILQSLKHLWFDIDHVLSGYIRGQLTDSLIMGVLIGISVAIIGIDFPIIIGIVAGLANIIPYFGPIIGMIPAALMGLISDNPMKALYAVVTLLILQQVDGAIIAPKIVGESVDVHPVVILVAIIIAGALFGILGLLLAVPVAALLKLLLIRYMDRRSNA